MIATLTPLPSPPTGLGASASNLAPTCTVLPFSAPDSQLTPPAKPSWSVLPSVHESSFPTSWPSPMSALPPDPVSEREPQEPTTPSEIPAPTAISSGEPTHPAKEPETADFTDEDLREAFAPLFASMPPGGPGAHAPSDLEPLLRATIRRALAEYTPASKPFQPPSGIDRLVWQMQALFTSRTFDDILFDKTRRFQVEEAYLLDAKTL